MATVPDQKKASDDAPRRLPSLWDRWYGVALLLAATVALLTFSYAPYGQFYLAWAGLVPWMIFVARARSNKQAFWWSWLAGIVFYVTNMWWLGLVTLPGTAALLGYIGIYWGIAAVVFRRARLIMPAPPEPAAWMSRPLVALPLMAGAWVALEWVRGHLFWGGLPWLYLGHSQTPILAMCQIADITGAYGVSFWVMLVNGVVAMTILHGWGNRQLVVPKLIVGVALLGVFGYGHWRLRQETVYAGPKVIVVQPNVPQSNTGEKGASEFDLLKFHLRATERALKENSGANLVVWSETVMAELNTEYPKLLAKMDTDRARERLGLVRLTDQELRDLTRQHRVALLTGGAFTSGEITSTAVKLNEGRNSAYYYTNGRLSELRYDKIHLVPFGEFIPFKESFPPLYYLINIFNPYGHDYTLKAGAEQAMTVFPLPTKDGSPKWKFVTPICFEDIDSELCAAMVRPEAGQFGKRADFLVNLTNDGWFKANQNALHIQTAAFRSIENRVPTARSVNTGISGFIDSRGRIYNIVPARTDGWTAATLPLDFRITFYTLHGDVFALVCVIGLAMGVAWSLGRGVARRFGLFSARQPKG